MNQAEVAEIAARVAIEYVQKEQERNRKSQRDRRLRNTRLLLKNYRRFAVHASTLKIELSEIDMLEQADMLDQDFAIESIKRSKERTLAIVKFVDQMLKVYRLLCESTGRAEDMRRYETVYQMYIAPNKMTADEIAECHSVDRSTVFRDIKAATNALTALFFGVDGVWQSCD